MLNNDTSIKNEGEWRVQNKSGQCFEVSFTVGLLVQPNGSRFRVTTMTDITKRKRLELERYRLFNFSLDMQSIIGFDFSFKEINAAWERTLGWTYAELFEKSSMDFVHPDDKQASLKMGQHLASGKTISDFENRYLCKDGTYKWLSWNIYPLVDQQTMYVVAHDMTERKLAHEKIQQQQAFIRLVLDSVPNLISVKDRYGNFIFVNQVVADLFGVTIDELLNNNQTNPCLSLEYKDELTSKAEEKVIEQRHEVVIEKTCQNAEGEPHCFQIVKKPFVQSNGEVFVLSVGTDITERKQQEKALKHSEARYKDIVAELKTILDNSVIGIAYIKNGVFIQANRKLESLLCYSQNELCGLSFRAIYPSNRKYQKMEQRAYPLLSRGEEYDAQYPICTKAGNIFWARLVGKAVLPEDLDKGSIWMIEDITVQKKAEQNMRLTARVFETSANGIIVTNVDKKIQRVNKAFSKITGYSATDVY